MRYSNCPADAIGNNAVLPSICPGGPDVVQAVAAGQCHPREAVLTDGHAVRPSVVKRAALLRISP